jgi:hypothetical protein
MPRLAAVMSIAVLSLAVSAGNAAAQPQTGLINVDISGNTVQVPVSVAANLCGTTVAVLAQGVQTGEVDCTANADAVATSAGPRDGGGPQEGLINVRLNNNEVQVPISVAANICGTTVVILAQDLALGDSTCDARGNSRAR